MSSFLLPAIITTSAKQAITNNDYIRREVEKALEILKEELVAITVQPKVEKRIGELAQPVAESEESDEFYECLVREVHIIQEE